MKMCSVDEIRMCGRKGKIRKLHDMESAVLAQVQVCSWVESDGTVVVAGPGRGG